MDNVFEGYNTCLFAYGQTGSGKTHTMMGGPEGDSRGCVPRLCEDLFWRVQGRRAAATNVTFHVEASYMEVYMEHVRDLLSPDTPRPEGGLRIRNHPAQGPYVEGLTSVSVQDASGVLRLVAEGNARRWCVGAAVCSSVA